MKRKILFLFCTAACLISYPFTITTAVDAATVDQVASTARQYGIPESVIQQGFNQYYANPDDYTSEDLDYAIYYIKEYHDEILKQFGVVPNDPPEPSTEPSTEAVTSPTDPTAPSGGNNRISQSDFIKMTLEEKQAYVASLPESEREAFLNSLSAEELKSIVKQLPADNKAVIVDKFVKASDSLGVKVTVNDITDDNISMEMRNKDGELIDVAAVGVIVEDTGYDHRLPYMLSAAGILMAVGGIWLVIRKCFTGKAADEDNE